jgi:radical SAM superfamily enzyme YgiQ (UPF0313 family)
MKILLLTPTRKQPMRSEAPQILRDRTVMPPLGLLRLHAALGAAGHEAHVFDADAHDANDARLIEEIRKRDVRAVGIGATSAQMVDAWRMCRSLKNEIPDLETIIGGPHASWFPEETAELGGVDFVLQGECDETLPALASAMENGGDIANISGLAAQRESKIIRGPAHAPVADLDALPELNRRALGSTPYRDPALPGRLASAEMTRGCPYDCAFCSTPRGAARHRAPDAVADELMGIQNERLADSLYFVDDTWNQNPKKALALCEQLAARGFCMPWVARLRINTMTKPLLVAMKRAGCSRVQLGVEAGCQEGLDAVNKRLKIEQVTDAFKMTREIGVETVGYFMLGLPTDRTVASLRRTVRFSIDLDPDYAMYNVFTPYPFTALHDEGVKNGLLDGDAWKAFAKNPDPQFAPRPWPEHLSPQVLYSELSAAFRRFYFRPRRVIRQLRQPAAWGRAIKAGIGMLRG